MSGGRRVGIATAHAQALERASGDLGFQLAEQGRERQPFVAGVRLDGDVERRAAPDRGSARAGRRAPAGSWPGCRYRPSAGSLATVPGAASMRRISLPMRSSETHSTSAAWATIAARVMGSMAKSSRAAMRTARSSRRASSSKRRTGSPTARTSRASEVPLAVRRVDEPRRRLRAASAPGDGVDGQVAASEVLEDVLAEGDRVGPAMVGIAVVAPEGGDLHARGPGPCRSGSGSWSRGRCCRIRSGRASVAMSQSLTGSPSSASRTPPPTR